jgi:Uma2 family endonuclease
MFFGADAGSIGLAMSSQRTTLLTPEEYLAIERRAERKSEYFEGVMYAMSGASYGHVLIVDNLNYELKLQLKGGPCRVHSSDLRLRVAQNGLYTYPDLMVICGGPQFADDRRDTVVNPVLIVEVHSESTQAYDRGKKFEQYRRLPSLREYLLAAQDAPRIEQWTRQPDDSWLMTETSGTDACIRLASIDCLLPLAGIYDQIEWPPAEKE